MRRGRPDEDALTADIIAPASQYGLYGYRRITALLRDAGWVVNVKRVERIWRREGAEGATDLNQDRVALVYRRILRPQRIARLAR